MFVDLVVDTFPYRTKKGSSKIWALGWLSPSHSAVFLVMVNAYILTEFWFWVLRCDINTWLEHVRSLCFKNICSCSPVGRVRPACGNHLLSELLSVWLCGQRFFFFLSISDCKMGAVTAGEKYQLSERQTYGLSHVWAFCVATNSFLITYL